MRRIAMSCIAAFLFGGVVWAAAPGATAAPLHLQDRAFLTYAIEWNLAQLAFCEMAVAKASDPEVKRLAERTIEYHTGSMERLQAAARRLDVEPPTVLNPVAERAEAMLKKLSGPAFDRAFLTSVVIGNFNGMYSARREMAHGFDSGLRAEGRRQAEELRANRLAAERLAPATAAANGVTAEDRNFLLYAMHTDKAQHAFAEIAAERATDPRVRALARELVDYHTRSYDRLVELARARQMDPLREVSPITSATAERLREMPRGPALDWTFLNAHAFTSYGAHYRYERESIRGGDRQVKAVAAEETRDARRQHWRSLRIMDDWDWGQRPLR
jgi:putative membrane protein